MTFDPKELSPPLTDQSLKYFRNSTLACGGFALLAWVEGLRNQLSVFGMSVKASEPESFWVWIILYTLGTYFPARAAVNFWIDYNKFNHETHDGVPGSGFRWAIYSRKMPSVTIEELDRINSKDSPPGESWPWDQYPQPLLIGDVGQPSPRVFAYLLSDRQEIVFFKEHKVNPDEWRVQWRLDRSVGMPVTYAWAVRRQLIRLMVFDCLPPFIAFTAMQTGLVAMLLRT